MGVNFTLIIVQMKNFTKFTFTVDTKMNSDYPSQILLHKIAGQHQDRIQFSKTVLTLIS